jgi:branched-chain amino acid transport system substrate-binding protein
VKLIVKNAVLVRRVATLIAAITLCGATIASGQTIKIGVLTDIAGPFSSNFGASSVEAAKLAAEAFGDRIGDRQIEILVGDHQNKPDIGTAIAMRWFDVENVDAIVDVPNSSVALAVQSVAIAHKKVVLYAGATSEMLSGKYCSPYTSQWVYTNDALAQGAARAILADGGNSWFFIGVDFTFGHSLATITARTIEAGGGKSLGAVFHPTASADVSSYLLQAMASKAKIIGLAEAGFDVQNLVKSAAEFNLGGNGQRLAALVLQLNDIDALGLPTAQGLLTTDAFYWDQDDKTRAFAEKFRARTGNPPNSMQAGIYSAVTHYLSGIKATGSSDPAEVTGWMRHTPVDDFYGRGARIREDGVLMHDMYLLRVKQPSESKGRWDYLTQLKVIPAAEAFPPPSSDCPLNKD